MTAHRFPLTITVVEPEPRSVVDVMQMPSCARPGRQIRSTGAEGSEEGCDG